MTLWWENFILKSGFFSSFKEKVIRIRRLFYYIALVNFLLSKVLQFKKQNKQQKTFAPEWEGVDF